MKKIFIFAMAAAFSFTACQKEGETIVKPIDDGTVRTIVANGGQALTKIGFSDYDPAGTTEQLLWKAGDKLIVFELAEIPASNSKGFTGYTMASTAGGATTTTNSTAKDVLTFDLIEGAGTSVATFSLDGVGSGLDKAKKYVAFHSPNGSGITAGTTGVIRPVSDAAKLGDIYGFRIQALNTNNATTGSTSYDSKVGNDLSAIGKWAMFASDNTTFWAIISFDNNDEMNPVTFKPTVQRYMDISIQLAPDVTSAVTFNSVKIALVSGYLLSYGYMSIIDDNLELKAVNQTSTSPNFTLTRTNGRMLDQTPVTLRMPFTIPYNATGNMNVSFEFSLTVDGSTTKTISKTRLRQVNSGTPAFEIGKIYQFSEPITLTQADLQ